MIRSERMDKSKKRYMPRQARKESGTDEGLMYEG